MKTKKRPKFQINASGKEWYLNLLGANGEVVLTGELQSNREDLAKLVRRLPDIVAEAATRFVADEAVRKAEERKAARARRSK